MLIMKRKILKKNACRRLIMYNVSLKFYSFKKLKMMIQYFDIILIVDS